MQTQCVQDMESMLEAVKNFVNIIRHGELDLPKDIVPLEGET